MAERTGLAYKPLNTSVLPDSPRKRVSRGLNRKVMGIALLAVAGLGLLGLGLALMGARHFDHITVMQGLSVGAGVVLLAAAIALKTLGSPKLAPQPHLDERLISEDEALASSPLPPGIAQEIPLSERSLARLGYQHYTASQPKQSRKISKQNNPRKRLMTILPDGFLIHPSRAGRRGGSFSTGGRGALYTVDSRGRWSRNKQWVSMATKKFRSRPFGGESQQIDKLRLPPPMRQHPHLLTPNRVIPYTSLKAFPRTLLLSSLMDMDLADLQKRSDMTFEEARKVAGDSLQGLLFLHKNGLVHNDFKLDNVFCVGRGATIHARVADFDLLDNMTKASRKFEIRTVGTFLEELFLEEKSSAFALSLEWVNRFSQLSPDLPAFIERVKNGRFASLDEVIQGLIGLGVLSERHVFVS